MSAKGLWSCAGEYFLGKGPWCVSFPFIITHEFQFNMRFQLKIFVCFRFATTFPNTKKSVRIIKSILPTAPNFRLRAPPKYHQFCLDLFIFPGQNNKTILTHLPTVFGHKRCANCTLLGQNLDFLMISRCRNSTFILNA